MLHSHSRLQNLLGVHGSVWFMVHPLQMTICKQQKLEWRKVVLYTPIYIYSWGVSKNGFLILEISQGSAPSYTSNHHLVCVCSSRVVFFLEEPFVIVSFFNYTHS